MAATNVYGKAFANLLGGESAGETFAVDWLSDTIKVLLTTSSYVPNLDTHETKADITNEVTGTNYSAGGNTLASKTLVYTAADAWATARANSTAYALGDVVRPATGNGHLYLCIVAGTSGGSIPTWPTVSRQTVADGAVTWAEIGRGITVLDSADPNWTTATIAGIKYAVYYKDTGTAGTSALLAVQDLDGPTTVTAGTFTIQLPVLGLFHFHTP
jgi:hypothetical protein